MNDLIPDYSSADRFIQKYRRFHLEPFRDILHDILQHVESPDTIKSMKIIELGPGRKTGLLRCFSNALNAVHCRGMGRSPAVPMMPQRKRKEDLVDNCYLDKGLASLPEARFDLIYSRHVMEQFSIHPLILLKNPVYWRTIRENRFAHPGREFPGSLENIEHIFQLAFDRLKPCALMVSQIAKMQHSGLSDRFLKTLNASDVKFRKIGKWSGIVSLVK